MNDLPAVHAEIDEIKSYTEKALTDLLTKFNRAIVELLP
jgi:hypothetical protein